MKFNWKLLIPAVIIVLVIFWGFDSTRTRSYSGKDLEFAVGGGAVTVNNSADNAVAVELVGSGVRSFSMINSTLDITSSSTRDGNGNSATQTLAFDLPAGTSEFAIARGRDVNFIATNTESIEATVQPVNAEDAKSTMILGAIVILICLFAMSYLTEHALFKMLRSKIMPVETIEIPLPTAESQGTDLKSFGDNRT